MGAISDLFGYLLNWLYISFNNYGLAIIVFSVILRILLIPITVKQQKSMKKSTKMQEEMKVIQNKYKNDPEKLNQATLELYKKEKFSPFSGCLSAIIQLFIILAVFWMVSKPLTYMRKVYNDGQMRPIMEEYTAAMENDEGKRTYPEIQIIAKIEEDYTKINEKIENFKEAPVEENTEVQEEVTETEEKKETLEELLTRKEALEKMKINMDFLGLNLSKVPSLNMKDWTVYIIPVIYVLTTFASMKVNNLIQEKNKKKTKKEEKEGEEKSSQDEALESMQDMTKSMSYMMPIMSISIAFIAPLGLALYWLVSNILMIIERLIVELVSNKKAEE